MASQAEAVQTHLSGMSHEAKLQWLAAHGSLEFVPSPVPGYRDVSLMNAAAGLVVAGQAKSLKQGVEQAAKSIDSGAAKARLDKLVQVSNA
jgi:anthranilate phosphoribosyltransferase